MAIALAFPDGTHMTVPDHIIPLSSFLLEMEDYEDDDGRVDVLIGTPTDAERALEAFQIIYELLPDIATFNAPTETTPLEDLETIRLRILELHRRFHELADDNEVYHWLDLTNPARKVLSTLEDEAFPFTHLKDRSIFDLVDKDITRACICECRNGNLPIARWLHCLGADIRANDDEAFQWACENGHETTARWLHSLGDVDIHIHNEYVFLVICGRGHESIARWLHSLGANIHARNDEAFRVACHNGREGVAKWLHSVGANIHVRNDEAFLMACENGHETTARWLHSLDADIHADEEGSFRWACRNGHESIARWLHSLGGVDIHARNDEAFQWACEKGHESIARWLRELGCGED